MADKKKPPKKEKKPVKKEREPTLKEKIEKTVDDYIENPDELKKQIFGLVQRVLYPDQFCPVCADRLFFGQNGWSCTNCGYIKKEALPTPQPTNVPRPSTSGKVPPQVEKTIQEAEKSMNEPRRVLAPTKKGENIRKLVDQMDTGGPSSPTPEDERQVRRDKNVSGKINWV